MDQIWKTLYQAAKDVLNPHAVSERIYVGSVGAAVLSKSGTIYTGICIDTSSSLGMCAERNALASMLTNNEHEVDKVCAVYKDGRVIPPCGACREFMMQLGTDAGDIDILLNNHGKSAKLRDLMPEYPF